MEKPSIARFRAAQELPWEGFQAGRHDDTGVTVAVATVVRAKSRRFIIMMPKCSRRSRRFAIKNAMKIRHNIIIFSATTVVFLITEYMSFSLAPMMLFCKLLYGCYAVPPFRSLFVTRCLRVTRLLHTSHKSISASCRRHVIIHKQQRALVVVDTVYCWHHH